MVATPSFPLTDSPWLRAQPLNGPATEVSALEALVNADHYRCLLGDVPTQVFAQLRLLLAIAHMALDGPYDIAEWSRLWADRRLPAEPIREYLTRPEIRDRMDLLHPDTPFYQVATLHTAKNEVFGLERLIADVPAGERFFTTRDGPGLERLTFAEAARWLVHCQAFDVSGIKSGAIGDSRVKGGKGYPIGQGQCGHLGGVYAEGANLAETLLLNLVPIQQFDGYLDPQRDVPVWHRPPHTAAAEDPDGETGRPYGPLDLYTWQSRRIRLFTDAEGVTGVLICNGDKFAAPNQHNVEPMTSWRRSKNQERVLKQALVYMPRTHIPSRSLWRGLESLLPSAIPGDSDPDNRPPKLLEWLAAAELAGHLEPSYRIRLHATGAVYGTQNSVLEELVDDAVTMPVVLLAEENGALRTLVRDAVAVAELAVRCAAALAGNLERARGADPDTAAAARGRVHTDAYARLDAPFRRWLAELGQDTDVHSARLDWEQDVRTQISRLGGELIDAVGPKAWVGREIDGRILDSSLAETWFRAALRRALPLAHSTKEATA